MILSELTNKELKSILRENDVRNYSKLNKKGLLKKVNQLIKAQNGGGKKSGKGGNKKYTMRELIGGKPILGPNGKSLEMPPPPPSTVNPANTRILPPIIGNAHRGASAPPMEPEHNNSLPAPLLDSATHLQNSSKDLEQITQKKNGNNIESKPKDECGPCSNQ